MIGLYTWVRRFGRDEGGLVTVEWVSLAAAVVVGGMAICWLVLGGLSSPATAIGTQLSGVASSP